MATVDVHYARAILQCSTRRGLSTEQLLIDTDLTAHILQQNNNRVAGEKITRMVKHTWARLDDEFMGCTRHPCKHGVFALMSKYALPHANLQQILQQGIHFYQLFTDDIKMRLVTKGNTTEFIIDFRNPELDASHFFHEFWLMIWHRFASWLIGKKIVLNQVSFPYPKPAHHRELKNAFPARHNFNQASMKLSFSSQYLALAAVRTAADLAAFLKNSPADLITIPGEENSYKTKIRTLLTRQPNAILNCPGFEEIAKIYNLSSQTLRRKLKAENTSYPQLKDDIRRDIAIDKLTQKNLSVAKIARLLGFSESRSFTRAFKKWTGHTPTEYISVLAPKEPLNKTQREVRD